MRVFKHALLSLKRKPTKAIMILGILFVVFAMVFTGIIINNTVDASKIAIRKEMGAVVDYTSNYMKAMSDELEDYSQLELSEEVANDIAQDPQVKTLYINRTGYAVSKTLQSGMTNDSFRMNGEDNMIYLNLMSSSAPVPLAFVNGSYTLTAGRYITEEENTNNAFVAIVSENFAAKNALDIGSIIEMGIEDYSNMTEDSEVYEPTINTNDYEVIGVYAGASENSANNIFTTSSENDYLSSIQFGLGDPLEVENFIARNKVKLPSEYNELTSGNKQFKSLTKPLNFVSTITNLFIGVVFVAGAIITIALVTIYVRDRRFEIGLLLSMGESRLKIVSQFIVELTIIAFIAFIFSMTASQLSSGYVSDWIAENQFVEDEDDTDMEDMFFMSDDIPTSYGEVTLDDVAEDFDAKISFSIILQLLIVSLSLVLIAASIPLIIIISYNPREALQS